MIGKLDNETKFTISTTNKLKLNVLLSNNNYHVNKPRQIQIANVNE